MAKGSGLKTTYAEKERVVPTSSGSSDLEFEGPAKPVGGDFEINGAKPVVTIGEGELSSILRELE